MKIACLIQRTGYVIFIGSLVLLIALLSIGTYSIDEEKIGSLLADKPYAEKLLPLLSDNNNLGKAAFLSQLSAASEKTNTTIYQEKALPVDLVEQSIDAISTEPILFNEKIINEIDELSEVQKTDLLAYSSWMVNQSYAATELKTSLRNSIQNINSQIISKHGISSTELGSLKNSLLFHSSIGFVSGYSNLLFFLTFILASIAGLLIIIPDFQLKGVPGIKNDGIFFHPMTSRKWLGILTGSLLIGFYIILYWFPYLLTEWIVISNDFSLWISGNPSSQWFVYGLFYTLVVIVMGVRMWMKYRHSNYHKVRTFSVIFFQFAFAFLIPNLLSKNQLPAIDLKNMWPLDYSFFFEYRLDHLISHGVFGYFLLVWGIVLFVIGVPIMTYFYGKRWYCSWVCGCGGLAETLGDPYRQLSDKSVKAWKIERYLIHFVLVFAIIMTTLVLYTYFTGESQLLGLDSYKVRAWYGFFIGSAFAGVVGTGFYPLMGNRTWCRFGCPLAAYMGIVQRFKSRFRITTNGGQCISCGNCSTYCEQGIDVRSYAQKGENIVRASCVGCGVCASVCPRGVLKLENADEKTRIHGPIEISSKGIQVVE